MYPQPPKPAKVKKPRATITRTDYYGNQITDDYSDLLTCFSEALSMAAEGEPFRLKVRSER